MNRNLLKTIVIFLLLSGTTGPAARSLAAFTVQPAVDHLGAVAADGILASTSFAWVDITGVGTPITTDDWVENDDEGQAPVALPWSFPWFGTNHTTLYVDANGNLGFEDWTQDTWIADNRIPSPNEPNNRIAAFYEDLAGPDTQACGGEEGAVYTYYDAAGNRFIVEYDRWCSWEDFHLNTFQVILFPDGRVIVQYQDVPSSPSRLANGNPPGESPAGIESPDGATGLWWYGKIQNGAAWLYQPYESIGENRLFLPLIQ